jgi:hypothetical protein
MARLCSLTLLCMGAFMLFGTSGLGGHEALRDGLVRPQSRPTEPLRRLPTNGTGVGQGPTKNPIVCLASDSRHWGLNNFDGFCGANLFNGLRVAKVMCKKNPGDTDRSEQGRGFRRP